MGVSIVMLLEADLTGHCVYKLKTKVQTVRVYGMIMTPQYKKKLWSEHEWDMAWSIRVSYYYTAKLHCKEQLKSLGTLLLSHTKQ